MPSKKKVAICHGCSASKSCIALLDDNGWIGCYHWGEEDVDKVQASTDYCFKNHGTKDGLVCARSDCAEQRAHIHGHRATSRCDKDMPPEEGELTLLACWACHPPTEPNDGMQDQQPVDNSHQHSSVCGCPRVPHGDHWDYITCADDGTPLRLEHTKSGCDSHNECHGELKPLGEMQLSFPADDKTQSQPHGSYRAFAVGTSKVKPMTVVSVDATPITTVMIVEGICCPSETPIIKNILEKLPGVTSVSVNVTARTTSVDHNPVLTTPEELVYQLNTASLGARLRRGNQVEEKRWKCPHPLLMVCGVFWLISLGSLAADESESEHCTDSFQWSCWVFYLKYAGIVAAAVGLPKILKKAFGALKNKVLDINCLMCIATIGAMAIQEFTEGGAVVFLFGLSEWLEDLATAKARNALSAVLALRPEEATLAGLEQKKVPVESVQLGDRLSVKPGDKVPVDGVIVSGDSALDQSVITGESMPVRKSINSKVSAGTINVGGGYFEMNCTAISSDSTVARMVKLIEEASSTRSKTDILVERFAKVYTPLIVLTAILFASVPWAFLDHKEATLWLYNALVLLVVACPCALVISTPVAFVSTLSAAASHNVLVRGGEYLESLGCLVMLGLDKTGTLTEGRFRVRDILGPLEEAPPMPRLLSLLAAVEQKTSHPVALALVAHCRTEGATMDLPLDDFRDVPGEGVEAMVDGVQVQAGSRRMARRMRWIAEGATGAEPPGKYLSADMETQIQTMENSGQTVCYLGVKGKLAAIFGVADAPRKEAAEALAALKDMGITTVMLTGDRQGPADAIARKLGTHEVRAELLPEDKVKAIQDMTKRVALTGKCTQFQRRRTVAMVGDGINDAAALAVSDVGIAMGAAGTQVAMENAHVALMDSDLRKLVVVIRLGRMAVTKIKQNITFAILSKVVMIVITFAGYASLWGAIIADLGAMLIVTLNASLIINHGKKSPKHSHSHSHSHGVGGCCTGHGEESKGHSHGGVACSGHGEESKGHSHSGVACSGHGEESKGHSHGGVACSGHGEESKGHSHGGVACNGHGESKGHSHGGVACSGHGEASNGHSHGGVACSGHGEESKGHSHGGGESKGHSHGGHGGQSEGHSHGGVPCSGHSHGLSDQTGNGAYHGHSHDEIKARTA